jgi:hypothetical protein
MSTGLLSPASAGRNSASGLAGVGAEDAGAAAVGQDRDAVALGPWLVREQSGDVEELTQSVRSNDARLLEQGVDRHVGGTEQRTGVGRRGAGTGGGAAALDREDRLLAAYAARDPGELARVAERFQVESDDVRGRIVGPVLDEVVAREVGLVADGDEGREAQVQGIGILDDGQPEGARLRQEPDVALDRRVRGERRVHPNVVVGVDDAHAVGSDDPHSGFAGDAEQFLLHLLAGGAGLSEAGGDDDHAVNALLGALAGGLHRQLGGHDDDGQVHRAVDVED